MRIRSRLVWKLSAMVVAIMTVAIVLSGYANNLICAHYSMESARAFLRFNSESIIQGIGQLMMSRNNQGIEELIGEMSRDSEVYGDVRLVSHHSGKVVASRFGDGSDTLALGDWACAVCHDQDDRGGEPPQIVDTVMDGPQGGRVLSVMAPILNKPGCSNAACHTHATGPRILGFLNADYSLDRMDALVAQRRRLIIVTVLTSLMLGIVALWWMFTRHLARPIRDLIAGTRRIAANDLNFRFDQKHTDEIGVLQASFNAMTSTIQMHQEELRSAKEYLEGIVENSADIIITVTPDGLIETFNRGAERALGYGRAEVIGRRIESLFADPRQRDIAIARLRDRNNVRNYETVFLTKDGQTRDVLLTLSRLRDAAGTPIGTFGISKDITEEKQLQRELIQSQKFAAIGQAVTGIQHAIKNMLNSLTGGIYLVRYGTAKESREQVEVGCAMVDDGIDRIENLSRNLLNYVKEWKPELESVDLCELLRQVGELNRHAAEEQGVAVRCELTGGLPAVRCDSKLIHVAITDLVVNAIDACVWKDYGSDDRPEVVLKSCLAEGGEFVVIEVRDNGCGMTAEIRRNVFAPFFSTKKNQGTGLGLATTARIISVHGGEVSVESEVDQGTAFRVSLPIDGPTRSSPKCRT